YAYVNFDLEEGTSGSVNITSINTQNQTISGTFTFTGWWSNDVDEIDPIEFTNGVFENIPYTGDPGTNPIGEDEFVATVDDLFINYANDLVVVVAGVGGDETLSLNANQRPHEIKLFLNTHTAASSYELTSAMFAWPTGRCY